MWTAIVSFLKAIPAMFGIITEIIRVLHAIQDYIERHKKAVEIKEAIKAARTTQDTSKLEAVFTGSPAVPVSGSVVPADVVRAETDKPS